MLRTIVVSLFAIFLGAASINAALADASAVRTQQVAFVKAYVAAMHARDKTAALSLMHPALRSCMTRGRRAYFDYIVAQQMSGFPQGAYSELSITPVGPKTQPSIWMFMPPKDFPYPIMPTYRIQVTYGNASNNVFVDLLEIAPSGMGWYWVTACPTAAGMRFVNQAMTQGAKQRSAAVRLAAKLKDPLRAQIEKLIAEHDAYDAVETYKKATGVDLTTASAVIDVLESQKP